jgi:predicted AAA+ superfamily ATPase
MNNIIESPFNPQFGKRPNSFVGRLDIVDGLMREYHDLNAPERVTIISGVRGSGKTSLLSDISSILEKTEDWIVVNVATTEKLLDNLMGVMEHKIDRKLNSKLPTIQRVTVGTPFVSVELGKRKLNSSSAFYPRLLSIMEELKKIKFKVIFVIDEVNNTIEMREFVSTYQLLIRENYDIVLLMAGLPHYVDEMLNDKVLTFLRRSNQIFLPFIEPYILRVEYQRIFKEAGKAFSEEALELAYISTGGYPYLYQLIGYFMWRSGEDEINVQIVQDAIEQSKGMLYQNVYNIIFSDLSRIEQAFLFEMHHVGQVVEIREIRERMNRSSGYINKYRDRLLKMGLIQSVSHGVIKFSLPFFNEYLIEQAKRIL